MLLLTGITGITGAQQVVPLKMIVKPREGAVWLRWAPAGPMAWKYANTFGYTIERYTIVRNGKVLPEPEKQLLSQTQLKPLPLPAWEKASDTSDYAAIVAQAIYGTSFNTNMKQEGALMDIVNRASELEQRFAYALFACDRSFPVAKMAGLGYVDKTVKPDEKYLYRVYTNIPPAKLAVDTGVVFTGLADEQPLPRPLDPAAMFGDRSAMLSWNYALMKDVYNSYIIERSSGPGQPFKKVNREPVINVNEQDTAIVSRIYYVDSLAANFTVYSYRIRGLDAFGETGPPSDTITGQGLPSLPYNPKITRSQLKGPQQVDFAWEFPVAGDALITGFGIISAASAKGPYDTLQRDIPVHARQWLLDKPLQPSNYMAVIAIGKNGTVAPSFPVLVQPEDTIPPAIPLGLTGTVDSAGRVFIHWHSNTEKDLMGYRIFRANRADGVFVQLTASPRPDTLFRDSVPVNTLHHHIYYKIAASDKRYNQSGFSAILELTKPDKVRPSIPVFSHYEIADGKVKLVWINSPDKEVIKYRLLRSEKSQIVPRWEVVKEFVNTGKAKDSITDAPRHEIAYSYTLQSVADNGLLSDYSPAITIIIPDDATSLPVPVLKTLADRDAKQITISWHFDKKGVKQFWLYRAAGKSPMSLLQTFDGTKQHFVDKNLEINNTYQYTLKVMMDNGMQSRFALVNSVVY
jgi:hypothetical protein